MLVEPRPRPAPPRSQSIAWFLRSRTRLLATLFLAVALPLGAFTTAVAMRARSSLHAQAEGQNRVAAQLGAQAVQALLEGLSRYVEAFARRPALRAALAAGDEEAVRVQLIDLVEGNRRLDRAFITDPAGVELFDWPRDASVIGVSFAFRDWYKGVSATGRTYVSEVYRRAATPRRMLVSIATPVAGGDGPPLGYLVAQKTIEALAIRLAEIRPGDEGEILLVDHHGHLVFDPPDDEAEPLDLASDPFYRRLLGADDASLTGEDPLTREHSLFSHALVPGIGWHIVARQPTDAVYAPARTLQHAIVGLSIVCLLALLVLGFAGLEVVRRHELALVALQGLKDRLSSMLVHDMRTPLATAALSIDLARTRTAEEQVEAREDLARAMRSTRRLRGMIQDVLDVMRMEEGALRIETSPQDLGSLVTARIEDHQALARSQGLELESELPGRPLEALVDADLISRVLDNLITNAVKHTRRGGKVIVRLAERPRGGAVLSVEDTGEGIAPEDLPRLFVKYGRAAAQDLGGSHDTGLGLVFCRMAVGLHGGKIEVESTVGKGSTFRVTLPRSAA